MFKAFRSEDGVKNRSNLRPRRSISTPGANFLDILITELKIDVLKLATKENKYKIQNRNKKDMLDAKEYLGNEAIAWSSNN